MLHRNQPFSYCLILMLLISFLTACSSGPALQVDEIPDAVAEPAPTVNYLSTNGVYHVKSYSALPENAAYGNTTVYYPTNTLEPFGAVAIAPGFTEDQTHMAWWGPRLASHGFAVMIFDTNDVRDYPIVRAEALISAIEVLLDENRREGSPLEDKIDPDKMAVMGHSMGGGGALLAANEYSDKLAAAITFTSWQPDADFSKLKVPTLVIAAEIDRIAKVEEHAWLHYQSIPDTTPKAFLEFAGANHFFGNTLGENTRSNINLHEELGRYVIAWLKYYLDDNQRYREFLYGDIPTEDNEKVSRYIINPAE